MEIIWILSIICADFISKWWVVQNISYHGEPIKIFPFFDIVHTKNFGVSFSLFYNHHHLGPWILGGASLIVVGFLVSFLKSVTHKRKRFALLAIAGGAIGNIIDRFYYGSVVDFLYIHYKSFYWPAFNIADSFIILGILFYVYFEYGKK